VERIWKSARASRSYKFAFESQFQHAAFAFDVISVTGTLKAI
jgi:hypothetical protein